jgi:hypothetical protein
MDIPTKLGSSNPFDLELNGDHHMRVRKRLCVVHSQSARLSEYIETFAPDLQKIVKLEIIKTLEMMEYQKKGLLSLVLCGSCGTTQLLTAIMHHLGLMSSGRVVCKSQNLVYRSMSIGKRQGTCTPNKFRAIIKAELKSKLNVKSDAPLFLIFDNINKEYIEYLFGDLLENNDLFENRSSIRVLIATRLGSSKVPVVYHNYNEAHNSTMGVLREEFDSTIYDRIPKVVVCPPLAIEQVLSIVERTLRACISEVCGYIEIKIAAMVPYIITCVGGVLGIAQTVNRVVEVGYELIKSLATIEADQFPREIFVTVGSQPGQLRVITMEGKSLTKKPVLCKVEGPIADIHGMVDTYITELRLSELTSKHLTDAFISTNNCVLVAHIYGRIIQKLKNIETFLSPPLHSEFNPISGILDVYDATLELNDRFRKVLSVDIIAELTLFHADSKERGEQTQHHGC